MTCPTRVPISLSVHTNFIGLVVASLADQPELAAFYPKVYLVLRDLRFCCIVTFAGRTLREMYCINLGANACRDEFFGTR